MSNATEESPRGRALSAGLGLLRAAAPDERSALVRRVAARWARDPRADYNAQLDTLVSRTGESGEVLETALLARITPPFGRRLLGVAQSPDARRDEHAMRPAATAAVKEKALAVAGEFNTRLNPSSELLTAYAEAELASLNGEDRAAAQRALILAHALEVLRVA